MNTQNPPAQYALREFVERHVFVCQTLLVEDAISKEFFSYDDIVNLYYYACEDCEELCEFCDVCPNCNGDNLSQEPYEIFEWYLVSNWFAKRLEGEGEAILQNDYGIWWGRSCSGQAIYMDGVVGRIYTQI